jgi:hypothetical protein
VSAFLCEGRGKCAFASCRRPSLTSKIVLLLACASVVLARPADATKPESFVGGKGVLHFQVAGGDFGTTLVGKRRPWQTLRLINESRSIVRVDRIAMSEGIGEFDIRGRCPVLVPGRSCAVQVAFTPKVPGNRYGTLTATYLHGRAATSLRLQGQGLARSR